MQYEYFQFKALDWYPHCRGCWMQGHFQTLLICPFIMSKLVSIRTKETQGNFIQRGFLKSSNCILEGKKKYLFNLNRKVNRLNSNLFKSQKAFFFLRRWNGLFLTYWNIPKHIRLCESYNLFKAGCSSWFLASTKRTVETLFYKESLQLPEFSETEELAPCSLNSV